MRLKKTIYCFIGIILFTTSCTFNSNEITNADFSNENHIQPYRISKLQLFDKGFAIKQLYLKNNFNTLWFFDKNRRDFLDQILLLEAEGINLHLMDVAKLIFFHRDYNLLNTEKKIEADLAFSEASLSVLKHLVHGKVNPNKYYNDWVIPQKEIDFNNEIINALSKNNITSLFQNNIPNNKYYNGIKEAIHFYEQLPEDTLLNINASNISKIKMKLNYFEDGNFQNFSNSKDEEFIRAVKKFQKRHGLVSTGEINQETLNELNVSKENRLKQLRVNLERARWFYKDFAENYVLVNIPECKLFLYENGKLIRTHDVIVGTNLRRTPVLTSAFNNLIVNPTWTIPPTILKNDVVPKATTIKGYFSNNRITIYDKKGNVVDPANWDSGSYKNYRYVQKPGIYNSLGLIKFDFLNLHSVYLHDTSNRSIFSKEKRDLSSGCVRVQNPFELALEILKIEGKSYSMHDLENLAALEKTKRIPLDKKVQVNLHYWTAWKDDEGIQFRKDIYDLDGSLYKKILQ